MERHEHLPGTDDFRDAQFDSGDSAARGLNVHMVVRLEMEGGSVPRIHFQPGVRRHSLEDGHLAGLRARVPVLDSSSRVENEWEFGIRLFGKGFPLDAEELGLAVLRWKNPVLIEASCFHFGAAYRERPLDSAGLLDPFVIHAGVIAEPARRNLFPFVECVLWPLPSGKEFFVA